MKIPYTYFIVALVFLLLGGILGFFAPGWIFPSQTSKQATRQMITIPGGNWGKDPYIKDGILYIDFYAHPTNPGDPPIKTVDSTIFFFGSWHHLCQDGITTPDPPTSDHYHCEPN